MDNKEMFRDLDEQERMYAPEQLPVEEQERVHADEGRVYGDLNEPPAAAPVASIGTTASSQAAPPNIGHQPRNTAPGDPAPQAGDPLDTDDR